MKIVAKMQRVAVLIENDRRAIADLKIDNLTAGVVIKTSYTEVSAKLQDIIITDMNPETIHPTVSSYSIDSFIITPTSTTIYIFSSCPSSEAMLLHAKSFCTILPKLPFITRTT